MRLRTTPLLAAWLVAATSHADTAACARVLDRARELRSAHKLHDSLRELEACTECDALADVCAQATASARAALPTLAVTVHGCDHEPLPEALVTIDGTVVAQDEPLDLDPGQHTVRAELRGAVEEQTVLLNESDRRRASLMIGSSSPRPVSPGAIVLGATSALAFASGISLAAWSISISTDALAPPLTAASAARNHDAVDTKNALLIGAEVAFAVSAATLITALVVWAFHDRTTGNGKARQLSLW
jgi:hypothetical protein